MQLKKLEFFGFKSFSDRTTFEFEKGITVVVGPNGCGKSNVVDAIKWILGEQKAKALRGNEMSDVIFNGTKTRPSMGYAEASLTILNDRNILPIEYEEVCITRRLYTSGESEYLINKQLCRLKDIKELFMDTGVGANCYSLIEQGRVDMLLQANAQERRFIFEEAAGISKYKSRKKETMSKLEKVEQNLLRLSDIIEEVQKQFRSVKLQASKAVKYNEYTDRLKNLSVQLSLKKYRAFKAERAGILDKLQQRENDGQGILVKTKDMQVKKDSLQEDIDKLISDLEKLLFDQTNIESKATSTHDKIGFNQRNIEELITQKDKYEKHVIILKDRISDSENSILNLTDNLQETKEDLSEKIECLSINESELKQYSLECDMLLQKIDGDKKRVIDILHKESSLQNEIGSLSAERDTISNRKIKLLKRQEEISLELEDLECEKQDLKKQRDTALNNIEHLKVCSSGINEKVKTLNVEAQSIVNNINSQQQLKSRKESRLEILEDLERRYEGVSSGAKVILEEAKNNNEELTGICGMVADLIRVDAAYVPAIEAVLGDKAQMIVTDSLKETIQTIDFLKRHEKGYVKFLPLNDVKLRKHDTHFDLNITGVIGKATDLVKSEERFQPLVEYMFKETIIVKDFETALTLADNGSNGFSQIVTLNGEVVEPGGCILAGMGNTQTGLISRKVELETIKQELAKLEKEIVVSMDEKNIKTNEIELLIKESDEIGSKTEAENTQKISNENDIREKDFKLDELNEEKEINESEINEIDDLIGNINQRELKLNDETKTLNDQRKNLESQVASMGSEKIQKETAKTNVQNQITELKVVIAQKEERRDSLNASLGKSKEELLKNKEELTLTQNEISNCREKTEKAENEIANLDKLLEELENEKVELEKNIVALKEKQNNYNEEIAVINNQIDAYREEYKEYESEINDLRLKENELKIKIENLEERIKDDYSVDISEFDMANRDEVDDAFDLEGVSQEIEQLKSKIGRMGNINPDAIQEQNELEARDAHLIAQMEDLQKSEKTLRDIIKKINITCRELFEKTFNDIRENFHELFRKLFGGGKADIVLEEGVDILDAGIDIIAQPPGKDLSSVMLFSGGEKVMVTIALLFAVFQTKPSPFCILDEVDAALDESNITRFTHILKEFAKTSQFLIITHNKNTMSIADVLYGVTMEEPGVSKKVSVKLKEEMTQVA